MSQIIQQGDVFSFAPSQDSMLPGLPTGNYILISTAEGYVFKRQEPFKPLGKLYGDHARVAKRIYRSFSERSGNTGALLAGTKGSGKSFLGRLLSQEAAEQGLPTILITEPLDGETLRYVLSQLDQSAVILLDEFEKVYENPKMQESFLGLLDGLSTTKHLFILTVNDVNKVDIHMKNRPGRLYYFLEFHGLEEDFIREFCQEKLTQQEHLEDLVNLTSFFDEFNFDMLNSLVEEMNRFEESPREAVRMLNISPLGNLDGRYNVKVQDSNGEDQETDGTWFGNPLEHENIEVSVWLTEDKPTKFVLIPQSLIERNARSGLYSYSVEGFTITLERVNGKAQKRSTHWTENI